MDAPKARPNLFIVGAPKAGTTALSEYLREHPQVFLSTPKEIHYFAEDFPGYRKAKDQASYLALFRKAAQPVVAEASVYHLYSAVALERIQAFAPDARIVAMLRNPVDMVHSLHSQLFYSRDEDEADFETAWRLQEVRRRGERIPRHCTDPAMLQYGRIGLLGAQVERLLGIFPRRQVHLVLFEDFVSDTARAYADTLAFLGLPPDGREVFEQVNPSKEPRLGPLADFTERPPAGLVRLASRVKKVLGIERLGLIDRLRKMNTRVRVRRPLPPALRREMAGHFAPDVRLLAGLLDRNLDHWLDHWLDQEEA